MTYIPYDPNIPEQLSDSLNETQPEFLNNFFTLYNIFAQNHKPLDDPSVPGNHTVIQLREQALAQQTEVSEISVYTKNDIASTDQIFLRYQGNGQEFAYTCYQIYGLQPITDQKAPQANQTPFFTFLPGRILLYFGTYQNTSTSSKDNINLKLYPPIATKIISVGASPSFTNNTTFFYKPQIALVQNKDGFFDNITILPAANDGKALSPGFYMVLANI